MFETTNQHTCDEKNLWLHGTEILTHPQHRHILAVLSVELFDNADMTTDLIHHQASTRSPCLKMEVVPPSLDVTLAPLVISLHIALGCPEILNTHKRRPLGLQFRRTVGTLLTNR